MLITFAYTLVRFYDSSIPGDWAIMSAALSTAWERQNLVSVIGNDSITSIQHTQPGPVERRPRHDKALMNPITPSLSGDSRPYCDPLQSSQRHRRRLRCRARQRRRHRIWLGPIFIRLRFREIWQLLFWGMAESLHRILLLQGAGRSSPKHPGPPVRASITPSR